MCIYCQHNITADELGRNWGQKYGLVEPFWGTEKKRRHIDRLYEGLSVL